MLALLVISKLTPALAGACQMHLHISYVLHYCTQHFSYMLHCFDLLCDGLLQVLATRYVGVYFLCGGLLEVPAWFRMYCVPVHRWANF